MKKDKKEHKKGAETTIGKIIYGFLLFMPLFAIGVSCLTCLWNKNITSDNEVAVINYKYDSNEVNSNNDLVDGNIYNFTIDEEPTTSQYYGYVYAIYDAQSNLLFSVDLMSTQSYLTLFQSGTSKNIIIQDQYGNITFYTIYNTQITYPYTFKVVYKSNADTYTHFSKVDTSQIPIESVDIELQPTEFDVKNIFYYSVDKITESPLFSWAQNSIVYTTLNNTCNTLSITTPFIPLLMSYWLIISVIYFLYDIALMLIWLLHNKIHELQESF